VSKIRQANDQIISLQSKDYDLDKLRRGLVAVVRSYALELHNDLERSKDALFLLESVESSFRDAQELSGMILEDISSLERQNPYRIRVSR
jgi:hypothetical protein